MSVGQLPQSHQGYVGIGKESTYGTGVSPSYYIDAISAAPSFDNQPEFQNSTRSRATHKGEAGPLSDEESIDMPAAPENGLGLLLLAAFGSESFTAKDPDSDSTNEVGEHIFTPADTLPALSVEVDRDQDTVRHLGAAVDSLELSHTDGEMLSTSVDMIAKEPDSSISSATPSYSDLRNFRWNDIDLTIDSTNRDTDIQEISFSIENNLDGQVRGNRTIDKIEVGEPVITATATLDFENTTIWELFLGSSGATSPQDQLANIGLEATWTTPETISDTSTSYSLRWNMPTCVINTHEDGINQNDLVAEDVEFRAIYDSGISAMAECELTNGVTTAY